MLQGAPSFHGEGIRTLESRGRVAPQKVHQPIRAPPVPCSHLLPRTAIQVPLLMTPTHGFCFHSQLFPGIHTHSLEPSVSLLPLVCRKSVCNLHIVHGELRTFLPTRAAPSPPHVSSWVKHASELMAALPPAAWCGFPVDMFSNA